MRVRVRVRLRLRVWVRARVRVRLWLGSGRGLGLGLVVGIGDARDDRSTVRVGGQLGEARAAAWEMWRRCGGDLGEMWRDIGEVQARYRRTLGHIVEVGEECVDAHLVRARVRVRG